MAAGTRSTFAEISPRDPKNPKEAGRFWSKGQHVAGAGIKG